MTSEQRLHEIRRGEHFEIVRRFASAGVFHRDPEPGRDSNDGDGLRVRIGLNSGPMIAGNLGGRQILNYTVLGHSVNLASRLEGLNRVYGTSILISEFTAALLDRSVPRRELDLVQVKGVASAVRIYELSPDTGPEESEARRHYATGLRHYRGGHFVDAAHEFASALQFLPADGPSARMLDRCKRYLREPPPEDWGGVWLAPEK